MASNQRALDKLQADLAKRYGVESAMYASDIPAYSVFSSGSLSLDCATGLNGFPTNRVIEIAGMEGSGKTTLALHSVNNRLKFDAARDDNRGALYIDIENRLTPDWVDNFVEEPEKVIVIKPDTMEQATDIYIDACKSGAVGIVVLDSIGGASSQRVYNKSAESGNIGGNALAVSRFANFAMGMSGKYDVTTIGINQIREDMDGYNRLMTPGGKAWKHACSLRIHLKPGDGRVTDIIDGEELRVGYTVVAKIVKNSLGAPYRTAYWWFYNVQCKYGFGVDVPDEIVRIGMLTGAITKLNSVMWRHPVVGDVRGRDAMIAAIKASPEAMEQIKASVFQKLEAKEVHGLTGVADESNDHDFGGIDVEVNENKLGVTLAEHLAGRPTS